MRLPSDVPSTSAAAGRGRTGGAQRRVAGRLSGGAPGPADRGHGAAPALRRQQRDDRRPSPPASPSRAAIRRSTPRHWPGRPDCGSRRRCTRAGRWPPCSSSRFSSATSSGEGDPMREPQHRRPYESVLETIGWTPLIRLAKVGAGIRTPIYAKAEHKNPGGSVKDRIGIAIIEDAEARGSSGPAARSWRRRAATPASASRWPRRSRATAASAPCPTRCRRRRCGC